MSISERIDYWTPIIAHDLGANTDDMLDYIVPLEPLLEYVELYDGEHNPIGILAWVENKDPATGRLYAHEVMMYLKPENRNIKSFRGLIKLAEYQCKVHGCKRIVIASNFGYNDDKVLRLLTKLHGYEYDAVRKDL